MGKEHSGEPAIQNGDALKQKVQKDNPDGGEFYGGSTRFRVFSVFNITAMLTYMFRGQAANNNEKGD